MKTISSQRAEKIARNINAMDIHYQYSDDSRTWRFWNNLNNKLRTILATLNDVDKNIIRALCNQPEAEYFGLA